MTEQNRVFYRIEKLPIDARIELVKEMLPVAHYILFKQRPVGAIQKESIEPEVALDKLSRASNMTWAFFHEKKADDVVDYEIYSRFDDPDAVGNELFMHLRVNEETGFEIKNKNCLVVIS